MYKSKITAVGNSSGIILTKEVLNKLHVKKGDEIYLVETEDGFKIISYDPDFERQIKIAEKMLRKYKETFRLLAKS